MDRPLVIFHSMNGTMHCDDGFAAAWVAWKALKGEADFHPGIYGHEPPDVTGRKVYLLDFSYKRPVMRRLLSQASQVIILDHHKTAEAELDGLTEEFIQRPDLIQNPPGSELPIIHFDMDHSGAMLAWQHFFPGQRPPELLLRIEDADLWRWSYADGKHVQAALRSHPQQFETWDVLMHTRLDALIGDGLAIRRFIDAKVRELVPNARRITLPGGDAFGSVPAINCPAFLASEVAGYLAEGNPMGWGCAYCETATHRVYSLRSRGEGGPDVSEIAKALGGGGRKNAAGFQVPLP